MKDAEAHHFFAACVRRRVDRTRYPRETPRFGAWWKRASHRQDAFAYNQAWQRWFRDNPNATRDQALEFGRELARIYGFDSRF